MNSRSLGDEADAGPDDVDSYMVLGPPLPGNTWSRCLDFLLGVGRMRTISDDLRTPHPVWLAWSGGKDSAFALHVLRGPASTATSPAWPVVALLTTVTEGYERVTMHGVRRDLLRAQVEAIGLRLVEVAIPPRCSDELYGERMATALAVARQEGVRGVAFGDIFLEDVRAYREAQLARVGMEAVFPLWGLDPEVVARRFIEAGFRAWAVCVDTQQLDISFCGRAYDEAFLRDLPSRVDPCGERGEFHTFVYDGPVFQRPVACRRGEVVLRDGRFAFYDLLPGRSILDAGDRFLPQRRRENEDRTRGPDQRSRSQGRSR